MSRTDRAKKLILDHVASIGGKIPNQQIAQETDLSVSTVEWIISQMRLRGEIPRVPRDSVTPVIGVMIDNPSIKVAFSSAAEANRNGFDSSSISLCLSGHRKSHAGYRWRKAK